MAFAIEAILNGYEVRGVESGKSKKGNEYRSIRLEDGKGRTCDVSCSDHDYFGPIDRLTRGDVVTLPVVAVAGRERSYIMLAGAPTVTGNAYTGEQVA